MGMLMSRDNWITNMKFPFLLITYTLVQDLQFTQITQMTTISWILKMYTDERNSGLASYCWCQATKQKHQYGEYHITQHCQDYCHAIDMQDDWRSTQCNHRLSADWNDLQLHSSNHPLITLIDERANLGSKGEHNKQSTPALAAE